MTTLATTSIVAAEQPIAVIVSSPPPPAAVVALPLPPPLVVEYRPPPPATSVVVPTATPLPEAVIRPDVAYWTKYVKGTSTLSTSLALIASASASEGTTTTTAAAIASSVSYSPAAAVVVPAPPSNFPFFVVVDTMPLLDDAAEVDPRYNDMRPTRDDNGMKHVQEEPSSSSLSPLYLSFSLSSIPVVRTDASKIELGNVCANKNWLSTFSFELKKTRRFYTNDESNYSNK